ncbi:winged helix-turn-helix domain-containing protein [Chloroflexota bacterium]
MRVNRRRSDIEIMADMLRVVKNGAGKTRIMYHTDMSYSQTQKYLWFLTNQGFLIRVSVSKSHAMYYATEKGYKLLETIDRLADILGLYNEDNYYIQVAP